MDSKRSKIIHTTTKTTTTSTTVTVTSNPRSTAPIRLVPGHRPVVLPSNVSHYKHNVTTRTQVQVTRTSTSISNNQLRFPNRAHLGVGQSAAVRGNNAGARNVKKTVHPYKGQPLYDAISSITRISNGRMDASQEAKVTLALQGFVLETTHKTNKCIFNFGSLGGTINTYTTTLDDGSKVPTAQYYKIRYNVTLKYPHLPMVEGSESGLHISYPIELLKVISSPNKVPPRIRSDSVVAVIGHSTRVLPPAVSKGPSQNRSDSLVAVVGHPVRRVVGHHDYALPPAISKGPSQNRSDSVVAMVNGNIVRKPVRFDPSSRL